MTETRRAHAERVMSRHILNHTANAGSNVAEVADHRDKIVMRDFDPNRSRSKHIRVVCLSDLHSMFHLLTPENDFHLPDGDVLCIAGDLTLMGEDTAIHAMCGWLDTHCAKYKAKVVVAGNHDLSFDGGFLSRLSSYYGYQNLDVYLKFSHAQKAVLTGISAAGLAVNPGYQRVFVVNTFTLQSRFKIVQAHLLLQNLRAMTRL